VVKVTGYVGVRALLRESSSYVGFLLVWCEFRVTSLVCESNHDLLVPSITQSSFLSLHKTCS